MVQTIMTHIVRLAPRRSRHQRGQRRQASLTRAHSANDNGTSCASTRPGSRGRYFAGLSRSVQQELSIGRQQAEGIEASAERGYRPEVTLICREDLISVVTISEDGVQ